MSSQILFQGAEAIISLDETNNQIIKHRIKKGYRILEIDEKLRTRRTKAEAKIINKLNSIINVPKIIKVDKENIIMENIQGKKLSDYLEELDYKTICKQIGEILTKLHNQNIIHGDLTTSNMIYVEDENENFKKQLNELKKLKLPKGEYAIFGSGPLAIRGIRESKDIDIIVKDNLWNDLIKKYKIQKFTSGPTRKIFIKIGNIEIYPDWLPWLSDTNQLIRTAEIIKDFPFVNLKYVIEWKKKFAREKDKEDIKLIEEYLNKENNFKIYLIDFGLGFHSQKIEDKAVDLHLLKQALDAKHYKINEQAFKIIIENYNPEKKSEILQRIIAIEKRGRYRH